MSASLLHADVVLQLTPSFLDYADKDVARGCSRLSEVRAAFIEAVEILDGAGRSVGENEQESILGKILGVSQSVRVVNQNLDWNYNRVCS